MITFTAAELVADGEAPTSRKWALLARAYNDRLRSGLGDFAWRVVFYTLAAFRQIRNPDASGFLYGSIGEFLERYQCLEPTQGEWPITGPGDPEGANVASLMGGYVFGAEALGVWDEATRLTGGAGIPLRQNGEVPESLRDWWQLSKSQRGAIVPDSGEGVMPARVAARSYAALRQGRYSPHGNSYGGLMALPDRLGTNCDDPDTSDDYDAPPNLQIKFTALKAELSDKVYPGTCQPGPSISPANKYDAHVATVVEDDESECYYVVLNDGSIEVLPYEDYVEGPYSGDPVPMKRWGGHLTRFLNYFSAQWRGIDQNEHAAAGTVPPAGSWNAQAFDFQRYLTSQNLMAPARGRLQGDGILAVYPTWKWAAPDSAPYQLADGTYGGKIGGGDGHVMHADCCLAACLVEGKRVAQAVEIEVVVDGEVVATVPAVPKDSIGTVENLVVFHAAHQGSVAKARVKGDLVFYADDGELSIEVAELLEEMPKLSDYFLALRVGGALADVRHGTDGSGLDSDAAKAIGQLYFERGVLYPQSGSGLPGQSSAINENAMFDAARRMSKWVRIIARQQLVGYSVEDGKSVLWFKRHTLLPGARVDQWDGIADEISHDAPDGGWSNEWLLGVQLKPYNPSGSSIWKPGAFTDWLCLFERAAFGSQSLYHDPLWRWHAGYGAGGGLGCMVNPELPTGFRYVPTGWVYGPQLNKVACAGDPGCESNRAKFYKSARIYEPDLEIESAEAVTEDGQELVKVTLSGRLHNTAGETGGAPSSIDRDMSTWTAATVGGEPFRTAENGIRLALLQMFTGYNAPLVPGDESLESTLQTSMTDKPYASIMPTIYLVKLIPRPHKDTNNLPDAADTPLWHEPMPMMDWYGRAMAEGCVDPDQTVAMACEHSRSGLYHFTFESACLKAFGGRWFTALASEASSMTGDAKTRPDKPRGHGWLPNTEPTAEVFNQFAQFVNELTLFPVYLPTHIECKGTTLYGRAPIPDTWPPSSPVDCYGATAAWYGTPAAARTVLPAYSDSSFASCPDPITSRSSALIETGCVSGSWSIYTDRYYTEFKVVAGDGDSSEDDVLQAVPPAWRDMVGSHGAVLASLWDYEIVWTAKAPEGASSGSCIDDTFWSHYDFNIMTYETITCVIASAGTLDAGENPRTQWWFKAGGGCEGGGGGRRLEMTVLGNYSAMVQIPLVTGNE